ncbi:quinolinate synthetase [Thermosyntropha lipolytica DSM 11003]|uniref:Quinolinate synthase n=1 Tax=Thermosyntropha lipolytica DSM 11003 TaxID=1123382 RepID=A0A1M5NF37_9FIRM|nr:quinolinate synthase NadA [Thermosyntropha lipolytica]SHG88194.1 quinolinate synthetase [Thermosyntropha lipolytica DSM 11003]
MLKEKEMMDLIKKLKKERSVFIIAHYYQRKEVQEIADFVGDSYAMALAAREADKDTILVAGVDFMAETAAILCPDKTILSPEPMATCPMADSVDVEKIKEYQAKNPEVMLVSYVNTPAAVKALSHVCVTSSNAEKIISKLDGERDIMFIPDRNLAGFIEEKTGRVMEKYPSCCPVHVKLTAGNIKSLKEAHPDALVLVHPECEPEIWREADYVGSTGGIIKYAEISPERKFIIGTEEGILYPLKKARPDAEFILAADELICPNMKSITLEKILYSLENRETVITVPEEIRGKALKALEMMIDLSR